MNWSKVSLFPLALVSLVTIYFAIQLGTGSLFKLGLDNELARIEQQRLTLSDADRVTQMGTINQLTEKMLSWDGYNPDHRMTAGYVEILNSFSESNLKRSYQSLELSAQYNQQSINLRPLYSDTFSQQAYVMEYQDQPFADIANVLMYSQKFGPFEPSTAQVGLDIFFSHWLELNKDQRLLAVSYLTAHDRYGITLGKLDNLISTSVNKNKMCNVAHFARISLRSCQ
jgi:hypothetical protein